MTNAPAASAERDVPEHDHAWRRLDTDRHQTRAGARRGQTIGDVHGEYRCDVCGETWRL